eukprot:2091897-Rhodomonas_salina.1
MRSAGIGIRYGVGCLELRERMVRPGGEEEGGGESEGAGGGEGGVLISVMLLPGRSEVGWGGRGVGGAAFGRGRG